MVGLEIAAIAKTTSELTKAHQKGFFNYILVSFFGPHYLRYLTRSLVLEGVAKTEAEKQIASFGENPHPAIALIQSEAEIEYRNMFGVLEKAIPKLREGKNAGSEIDPDKLKRLKDLSKDFSSNEMQEVIAGILTGEYNQPGTFSLQTMDIVKSLSKDDIELFKKFCGLVINDHFILGAFTQTNSNDFRQQIGLQYLDFLKIQELGLFAFRDSSLAISPMSIGELSLSQTVFQIGNRTLLLRYKSEKMIGVITLTTAGKELRKILDFECPDSYQNWINETLQKEGFETEALGATKT